ncbi:MAG TPA: OmpA family protein [Saprospiraceae bacterium]|nr:OmpA family protein [Saprospiraceae bacterium]
MTTLIVLLCIILIGVVAVQIGKVTELAAKIKGEEEAQSSSNRANARLSLLFVVVFLPATVISAWLYKNWMLGYGPHAAASEHGGNLDFMFDLTLFFTGIVFIITHILLFWFAYKYAGRPNQKVLFQPHDTKLEIIWTAVPAVVMTLLVMGGLDAWNDVMADVGADEDFIEIEATGMQFAWLLRYPGADGKLGERDYKKISGTNPLGQVWSDDKNLDDLHPSEIVLPKGKKVRVRIIARDVLHNFDLPHFRVKMDAVPGIPTYFVFTPTKTTAEYRQELSKYEEYQQPADPADPNGPKMWEVFDYELACAELCGKGHYSMRRVVRILEEEEYNKWLSEQSSYYLSTIRKTDEDPYKNVNVLPVEGKKVEQETRDAFEKALSAENPAVKILKLSYVFFKTGSAQLETDSKYQLDEIASILSKADTISLELAGHTDNTGDSNSNQTLSQTRAESVYAYLIGKGVSASRLRAVGYGQNKPIDTNDTEEGRANNRRTELRILSQ